MRVVLAAARMLVFVFFLMLHIKQIVALIIKNTVTGGSFLLVHSLVFLQRAGPGKALVTLVTKKSFANMSAAVHALVRFETAGNGKRLVALITSEGSLACVDAGVGAKITHLREGLVTNLALVGLLSAVHALVNLEVALARKLATAQFAGEGPLARVGAEMDSQRTGTDTALATVLAQKGGLARAPAAG